MRLPRPSFLSLGLSSVALSVPFFTLAASPSLLGPIISPTGVCKCPGSAPNWGCLLQVAQNCINVGIALAVVGVVLVIAYAGFTFMTSSTNAEARVKGRRLITNALIGLIVMLGAWLAVDFIMKTVYDPTLTKFGPWNGIWAATPGDECIQVNADAGGAITTGTVGVTYDPVGGAPVGIISGGKCSVPSNSNNPCSTASLASTCFASGGSVASQVCMLESRNGTPDILSGSDKLNNGAGPSYSVGLWQINLTTATALKVDGRSCTTAFTTACQGDALRGQAKVGWCSASIKEGQQAFFAKCVKAAQDPKINTQVACDLKDRQGQGYYAWHCSSSRCQVPGVSPMSQQGCRPGS